MLDDILLNSSRWQKEHNQQMSHAYSTLSFCVLKWMQYVLIKFRYIQKNIPTFKHLSFATTFIIAFIIVVCILSHDR